MRVHLGCYANYDAHQGEVEAAAHGEGGARWVVSLMIRPRLPHCRHESCRGHDQDSAMTSKTPPTGPTAERIATASSTPT